MSFRKGADPFAGQSQEPMDLFSSVSAVELASAVPFIKIVKIDDFGRPATDVRPLMYDLIATPQFGSSADDFGLENDAFIERALVSLERLTVVFEPQLGVELWRDVTIEFTVHHPAVVFDRNSKIAWREIMEEGKSFSLEYGWSADPTVVQNELFNGHGMVTASGLVIKSTQSILLNIYSYSTDITSAGEVKVTVKAKENGDLALRESKFSDAFELTFPQPRETDDKSNIDRLKVMLNGLVTLHQQGRGEYYRMGDILDNVIAPMIVNVASVWGYRGTGPGTKQFIHEIGFVTVPASPAVLLLGRFNKDAPAQSEGYFGQPMAGHGIEDFLVPKQVLINELSTWTATGRSLQLKNFINMMLNMLNKEGVWNGAANGSRQPYIQMKTDTVRNSDDSHSLIVCIYDLKTGTDPWHSDDRLDLGKQTRADVFTKLKSLNVPVLAFATAGSLITQANFSLQPDALLQAQQMDSAYRDRKDRVQKAKMPNTESRVGQSRNGDLIIPISILEGSITMVGNFVFSGFALLWIDFFGSSQISGVFHVNGKTDVLESGKFTSQFKVRSEGIDPLNTRTRRTTQELADIDALSLSVTGKKPKRP